MVNYFILHGLDSWIDYSPTEAEVKAEIDAGYPVVAVTWLTVPEGHWVLIKGYTDGGHYIVNDPYGSKPYGSGICGNYNGADVQYTWSEMRVGERKVILAHGEVPQPKHPKPTISASEYETEVNVGETDWVKFTVTNDGTEHTESWGIQVKVGDGLELVSFPGYSWDKKECNDKAAEWYKTDVLNPGDSAYIWVGINGTSAGSSEVKYTAWMYDPDGQPEPIQYAHPVYEVPCNREYEEYGVEVTLPIQPPQVTTNAASGVGTTSATLNGNLDSTGGEDCQVWFQYGKTTSYSDFLPSKSKSSPGSFSDVVSGLDDDMTYHFRAVASNSEGTVFGSDMTFKTDKEIDPPQVTTNAATNVEETTATLNGVLNSDGGEACQYRFEYDTNPGEPYAHNTGWTGSKTTGQSFNAAISRLAKGTKYYFRAQAKNSAGTASGSELTFLTKPDAPTSFSATTAGTTQIDLSWSKGAGAQKTKIQRKQGSYPANRNDGTQVYFDTGSSTADTGLTLGTTYYYRAWSYVQGSEQWSDNYAQDWATTTSIGAPTVTTNAASGVGTTSATLNGNLDDTGGESCQVWFEYGKTTSYGSSTSLESKSSTGSFSKGISGLDDDTTYHFRAVASNSEETDYGDDKTFTTSKEADTTPPTWDTTVGIQSATDTGNGGEVTVTYGTATDADSPPVKYNVYYSTSSPATGGTKLSNVGSSPYTVTGLTNGQLYYFSVRAEDSATSPNEDTNTVGLTATPTAPDPTPPSAVTDLSTINPTSNSIKLTWTAPDDDGNTGTATTYDIRYLEGTPITESDWASAIQCTDEPSPNPAGSAEAFVVTGLSPDTTYYFALKTADEVPNWSPISNSPSGTTEPGEVSILSIDPSSSKISAGSTTKINPTLDKAPNGLSGYNLTVSLSNVTVAEIVSVSFPSWATLHDISSLPADSVWMKATDLSDQVKSGATDINLGTLTLRGDNQGTSDIVITVTKMDNDKGYPINPNTISGQIEVTSVIPIPGHTNPPTDPDSDGLYEDLNGNGMKDFDDVVQFFKYMEWIEDNEPIACFDFNGNGLIDFADLVALFKEV